MIASRAIDRTRRRPECVMSSNAGSVYYVSLGALTITDVYDLIDLLAPGLEAAPATRWRER